MVVEDGEIKRGERERGERERGEREREGSLQRDQEARLERQIRSGRQGVESND